MKGAGTWLLDCRTRSQRCRREEVFPGNHLPAENPRKLCMSCQWGTVPSSPCGSPGPTTLDGSPSPLQSWRRMRHLCMYTARRWGQRNSTKAAPPAEERTLGTPIEIPVGNVDSAPRPAGNHPPCVDCRDCSFLIPCPGRPAQNRPTVRAAAAFHTPAGGSVQRRAG